MFQFLFRYPPAAYARGHFVLLAAWPAWVLPLLVIAAAGVLLWLLRRRWNRRTAAVWGLQSAVIAVILLLLWQPALAVSELQPEQNIVAVLVDDSRSMALPNADADSGPTREQAALNSLQSSLLPALRRKYQTRVFSFDSKITRLADAGNLSQIKPAALATRIQDSLRQLLDQTGSLPVGAVVLLSDGADAGVDSATMAALAARHIPIHTVGFGSLQPPRDVSLDDVELPAEALAKSRVQATVSVRQNGFASQHAALTVRSGNAILASQPITLPPDGQTATVPVMFNAGPAAPKTISFELAPLPGESSRADNTQSRLINVVTRPQRVLYIEGEPRWEYKFIRRAEAKDSQIQLVSMVRATQNKIYRQGVTDPAELADGFPARAQDLFRYQALIIGSVEAAYFTPLQQDLIQAFAERRGGGILFLGGQYSLADGGWADSAMAPLLPLTLPSHKATFVRADLGPGGKNATAALTSTGGSSIVTRLVDDPAANARKWRGLPFLMDYQDAGIPKPGATVLANVLAPDGRTLPLLTLEDYGRGRTAVLATSGTWRWQMNLPLGDPSHDLFWNQLVRWLSAPSPGQLTARVSPPTLYDSGAAHLTADVRDADYNPAAAVPTLTAHIQQPDGAAVDAPMQASPQNPGEFSADFNASLPGPYLATINAPGFGQTTVSFERFDGVAENFHTEQNRDLLERLAHQTGGAYWQPSQAGQLAAAIPYSSAGIATQQNLPLWNLPINFLLLLLLPLGEWFLRRKWGVV
ncbi:MAG TPA: vWA domain-containing protein [Terriglobales bacterium]